LQSGLPSRLMVTLSMPLKFSAANEISFIAHRLYPASLGQFDLDKLADINLIWRLQG
jgi:hypothetical protein